MATKAENVNTVFLYKQKKGSVDICIQKKKERKTATQHDNPWCRTVKIYINRVVFLYACHSHQRLSILSCTITNKSHLFLWNLEVCVWERPKINITSFSSLMLPSPDTHTNEKVLENLFRRCFGFIWSHERHVKWVQLPSNSTFWKTTNWISENIQRHPWKISTGLMCNP